VSFRTTSNYSTTTSLYGTTSSHDTTQSLTATNPEVLPAEPTLPHIDSDENHNDINNTNHIHTHEHEKLDRIDEEGEEEEEVEEYTICEMCHSKTSSRHSSRNNSKTESKTESKSTSKSHSSGSAVSGVRFTLPDEEEEEESDEEVESTPSQLTVIRSPQESDTQVSSDEETTVFIPKEESMAVLPSLGADFFFSPNMAEARDKNDREPTESERVVLGFQIGKEEGDVSERRFSKELRELRQQQHSDNALDRSQIARSLVGTEFPHLAARPIAQPDLDKGKP
jgi:hypothetical protein